MKKLSIILSFLLIFGISAVNAQNCSTSCAKDKQSTTAVKASPEIKVKDGEKIVLFKANVECDNCKAKIEKNMAYVKGVKDVKACTKSHVVTIAYDPKKTTEETLLKELQKLGMGGEIVRETKCSKSCSSSCTKATEKEK